MTVREIRLYGDPVLRTVCDPVLEIDAKVRSLIEDLIDTTKLPGRAGVAAPQIGVSLRAFSYNVDGKVGYLINPEIVEADGHQVYQEGCLSVPGIYADVKRANQIRVRALDRDGQVFELDADGLLAVCIQHEMDHLAGKVFVDYLSPLKREQVKKKLAKQQRSEAAA